MSLLDKLRKNSSIKETAVLSTSKFYDEKEGVPTDVPIINAAFSADIDGGFVPGLTTIAGKSKHFKTVLGLICVRAYLNKYPDAVCLMYDSEFGSPPGYLASVGIDTSRVVHTPIKNVEELRTDLSNQLEGIERDDKVMVFIDSIGNLASKKEIDDALDGKNVADMTRAKQIKSLWRICTPYFTSRNIPCVAINHTYDTMEMYSKAVVSGGTGGIYSSDTIFIIGKAQERESNEVVGTKFTINVEKSRFVREGTKFPFVVRNDGTGIDKWSGLLDFAIDGGYVVREGKRVVRAHIDDDKKWWAKNTSCSEFWNTILEDTDFKDYIKKKVSIGESKLFSDTEDDDPEVQLLNEDDD